MKNFKIYLSSLLSKFIPVFREIEKVIADKEMSDSSKVKSIKWILIHLDSDLQEEATKHFQELVMEVSKMDEAKVTECHFFKGLNFNSEIFLN